MYKTYTVYGVLDANGSLTFNLNLNFQPKRMKITNVFLYGDGSLTNGYLVRSTIRKGGDDLLCFVTEAYSQTMRSTHQLMDWVDGQYKFQLITSTGGFATETANGEFMIQLQFYD
jgi:hypothetical protein